MTEGLRVVLVAPRNPLNIGAAARAMSNFGFTEMRLVNPYDVAFHEAKSAVKSKYILDQAQVFENGCRGGGGLHTGGGQYVGGQSRPACPAIPVGSGRPVC